MENSLHMDYRNYLRERFKLSPRLRLAAGVALSEQSFHQFRRKAMENIQCSRTRSLEERNLLSVDELVLI